MKPFSLTSSIHVLNSIYASSYASSPQLYLNPMNATACLKHKKTILRTKTSLAVHKRPLLFPLSFEVDEQVVKLTPRCQELQNDIQKHHNNDNTCWFLVSGAVSIGFVLLLAAVDDHKALALGPEGPLVEEFWDNVRRYALYALTVSTGALYTIFLPILELLKNPFSAILVLVILGGSIYVVSQVVSAMVGVTDFTYNYDY